MADTPEVHEHVWAVRESGRCNDGHDLTISVCECDAEKHEWPGTEEYIFIDPTDSVFKALITHHFGALFIVARRAFVAQQVGAVYAELARTKQTNPAMN